MGQKSLNWRQGPIFLTKKIEKSYQKKVFREVYVEAESPQQANLTLTQQPQLYQPKLYVEGQSEPVDEVFQEFEILNEEFENEDVEDLSQGLVD
jgi:hypothetical protein